MKPQNPANSPRPGSEVVERQRVDKVRAAQRLRSWTVQNQIRNDSAGRILDSREIKSSTYGCIRWSADERIPRV